MGSRSIQTSSPSDLTQARPHHTHYTDKKTQIMKVRLHASEHMGQENAVDMSMGLEPDYRGLSPMLPGFVSGSAIY